MTLNFLRLEDYSVSGIKPSVKYSTVQVFNFLMTVYEQLL